MTIKEISELTGANEKTIRTKLNDLFPGFIKRGKKTVLNKEKVNALFLGLKTKGIISEVGKSSEVIGKSSEDKFERMIESMNSLAAGLMANAQAQNARLEALEGKFQKRIDALPAPQISTRNEISKIVREYANKNDLEFRDVWHTLYDDFNYRMKRHFSQTAKRRGLKTIDFIESEGYIGELLAVAREIFNFLCTCGKEAEEKNLCVVCDQPTCQACQADYNQFSQIDYTVHKNCLDLSRGKE